MPSVFGCIPSGSRYGNVPNELIHRAGPPFLDNHNRGYQYISNLCCYIVLDYYFLLVEENSPEIAMFDHKALQVQRLILLWLTNLRGIQHNLYTIYEFHRNLKGSVIFMLIFYGMTLLLKDPKTLKMYCCRNG